MTLPVNTTTDRFQTDAFAVGEARAADTLRTVMLQSSVALVENLESVGVRTTLPSEEYSPVFQVCLPYRGVFVWHVGHDDVVGDANQVLFVAGGEAFYVRQPRRQPYSELVITPNPNVLAELMGCQAPLWKQHPLFRRRSCRANPALQRRLARFLHAGRRRALDTLEGDEAAVHLLREALQNAGHCPMPKHSTRRLTERAKEFLHAHVTDRVHLSDIADAVGASPAYLTDLFGRVEGVTLHRYLTQLRLSRALMELPSATDLTDLALRLGFSSHSHFTAAFRQAFGETPSGFRADARRS